MEMGTKEILRGSKGHVDLPYPDMSGPAVLGPGLQPSSIHYEVWPEGSLLDWQSG